MYHLPYNIAMKEYKNYWSMPTLPNRVLDITEENRRLM
jgi:hypothetical protein